MGVYPIPNQEAVTVAKQLTGELFEIFDTRTAPFGPLKRVERSHTTPKSDGLVDQYNRTLLKMVSTTVKDNPHKWKDHIRKIPFERDDLVSLHSKVVSGGQLRKLHHPSLERSIKAS